MKTWSAVQLFGKSVSQSSSKCQYQWSWDKPYSPGCNHLCPMLQFGSKHVGIEDVHIFKHCHEMTGLLLWIGTYCISCVVQQTSRVKDLSSLVRYDDSCLAAIRHVQSIIRGLRLRPNIRSHSVLFYPKMVIYYSLTFPQLYVFLFQLSWNLKDESVDMAFILS